MNEIDMRPIHARRLETMKQIACLEHRRIERLAVERHERSSPAEIFGDEAQHRTLAGEVGQEMLLGDESTLIVEPAAADEKRESAGAAIQPGRLEVEKNEWHRR